jgi:hypothetical protein
MIVNGKINKGADEYELTILSDIKLNIWAEKWKASMKEKLFIKKLSSI